MSWSNLAQAPQLLKPTHPRACALQRRKPHNEKPTQWGAAPAHHTRERPRNSEDSVQPEINKKTKKENPTRLLVTLYTLPHCHLSESKTPTPNSTEDLSRWALHAMLKTSSRLHPHRPLSLLRLFCLSRELLFNLKIQLKAQLLHEGNAELSLLCFCRPAQPSPSPFTTFFSHHQWLSAIINNYQQLSNYQLECKPLRAKNSVLLLPYDNCIHK